MVFNLEEIRNDYKRYLIETRGKDDPRVKEFRKIKTHEIINEWVRPKLALYQLDKKYRASALDTHYITHGGLVPFTFRDDLSYDQFAHFAEHNLELPGVDVRVSPRREYLYGSLASHILGYVKQWEKGEISSEDKLKFKHYTGDSKGIAGVEATMNDYLTGDEGIKTLLKNEKGQVLQMVDYIKPDIGSRVELTIDSQFSALSRTRCGASGELLPSSWIPTPEKSSPWPPCPISPQASSCPASILTHGKTTIPTTLIHWSTKPSTTSPLDPPSNFPLPSPLPCMDMPTMWRTARDTPLYGKIRIHCWKRTGHGTLGLQESIQRSCNCYFMRIANEIGSGKMLNSFPTSRPWQKDRSRTTRRVSRIHPGKPLLATRTPPGSQGNPIHHRHDVHRPVGQRCLPLQLAALVSSIANRGYYYKPRIVKSVIHPRQGTLVQNRPILNVNLLKQGLTPSTSNASARACGSLPMSRAALPGAPLSKAVTFAQKQVLPRPWTKVSSQMMPGQSPLPPTTQPKYVVVVAVKRGSSGGAVAGPLVHLILRGLFARDEGLELPLTKMKEYHGDFIVREKVELPEEGELLDIAYEDSGETGNEISDIPMTKPITDPSTPRIVKPTIKQRADAEGSIIPKAIVIEE